MRTMNSNAPGPELSFGSEIAAVVTESGDAAGDVTTTETMAVGDVFQGSLQVSGDTDWVAINLVAGEIYGVDLFGTGGSGVSDTFLRIYDQYGDLLFSNDDGGVGWNSFLNFTATYTGTFYIEADSYNNNKTGDYQIEVAIVLPPEPTDALIWGGAILDNSQTITVYFALAGTTVDDEGTTITSDGFTQPQIDAIIGIFSGVSGFENISFQQTTNQAAADIQIATDDLGGSVLGYMYPQGTSGSSDGLGIFTSNPTYWNDASLAEGGFMYSVIIHELGHGLGLAHPHDNGGGSDVMTGVNGSGDTGDFGEMNQSIFTIMSYNDGWNGHPMGLPTDFGSGYMSSFAALDIAVLQSYYGTNSNHNGGNTVYSLGSQEFFETLWDSGGRDTIMVTDGSNAFIDLRAATLQYEEGGAGYVSYTSGTRSGFTIANGVIIENATGGNGDDTITGNAVRNVIKGKGGKDIISAEAGNDKVLGGSGADRIYGGTGKDQLYGGNQKDKLFGNSGSDSLFGENGNDQLRGGGGSDQLSGGLGKDLLVGGNGNDVLDGGADADRFRFDLADGNDDIVSFTEIDRIDLKGTGLVYGDLAINIVGNTATISFGSTVVSILDLQADLDVSDFIF